MPDAKEAALIERAKTGDRAAFGQLIRVHQRRVYACAIHMLADRGEAEDAVQETFLRAFRAIDRFDGRAELSTWLYRICINVSLNTLRRRRRVDASDIQDPRVPEPAADPMQGGTDPRHVAAARELYGKLGKALDELSPSLRATVIMVLIDGVPQKEAAEALGCSEGTIAWRVHESRRRLREKLGDFIDVQVERTGGTVRPPPPPAAVEKIGSASPSTPAVEKIGSASPSTPAVEKIGSASPSIPAEKGGTGS